MTGNERDEAEGLSILHAAIDMTPHGHPNRALFWSNLGVGFVGRFRRLGHMDDIERSISLLQWSVQATSFSDPSMPNRLGNLGSALSLRCTRIQTLPNVDHAIATLQSAVGMLPNGDPRKPTIMGPLGAAHSRRFELLDSLEDLNLGISALDIAIQLSPNDDPNKLDYMGELGLGLTRRFERLGTLADLDRAISMLQFAVDVTSDQHPEKPSERLGSSEILERSILTLKSGAEMLPNNSPNKSHCLSNLGMALCTRFERQKSQQDLQDAVQAFQAAVNSTHDNDRSMSMWLNNLSYTLMLRFELLKAEEDIERAVSSMQVAVALAHEGHSMKAGCLNLLGSTLLSRYEAFKRAEDAELGITTLQTALDLTPKDHPNQPIILVKIGDLYVSRSRHENRVEDLDQALEVFLRAAKSPTGSPTQRFHAAVRWARCENFLSKPRLDAFRYALEFLPRIAWIGLSVGDQHSLLANIGFIVREAVSSAIQSGEYETAVEWTEQGRSIVWQHVLNLRTPVDELRKTHPELADRFWAISREIQDPIEQDLVSTRTETSQPEWVASRRRELSIEWDKLIEEIRQVPNFNTFLRAKRFEELSNVAQDGPVIILNADEFRCDALILIWNEGRASVNHVPLKTLSYKTCSERLGSAEILERSISTLKTGVEMFPDNDPNKCHCFSNLGMALCTRFERQLSRQDLEDAIKAFQTAVNLTHDSDRSMPKWLNNLSHSLLLRFGLLEMEEDIERAVSSMQVAVALAHEGHSMKTGCLNLLGTTLLSRYKAYKRAEDAELGITTLRTALSLTPRDHPSQPIILVKIGDIYVARYEHENKVENLDQALEAFLRAAKSPAGSPNQRFHAAVRWARCDRFLSNPPIAAFRYALEFLPRIAWIGLSVGDQHSLLANIGFIVREAVSSAIEFGEYETAVEWTEQGRSIVWQHVLNLRTPVDELRKTHPELADRFWAISREIQDPIEQDLVSTRTETSQPEWVASRRRELSIEWDKLIEEIRRVPKFNTFLRAKRFEELSDVAQDGPVVILNADESRCDALVLIQNEGKASINHIPLKTLSYKTCVQLFEKLKTLLSRAGVRTRNLRVHEWVAASPSEGEFKNILSILWKHVNVQDPPHIWWCATGPLAFLPIHAAGLYDKTDPGQKLSDFVVSSYCPTLTSLSESPDQPDQTDFKILTVAQPETPNAAPIPQTEDEVKLIQQIASEFQVVNLTREEATVDEVLRAMQDSSWAHLACHGQQCIGNAMDSGILLQDGVLKLSTVVRAHLPKAQFAFLSACQTAMGEESVSEESAHLAAGMLLAGYRGVIATMWSIGDNDAPRIAEDVYRRVLEGEKPNWKEAARALHDGVKTLRDSGAGFISWVPFIHIGR
ncbi:hypothetical protein CPB86DRAFT_796783 [Serendipita vermifera]|nr:hypothetical protein CPB86DRAFT_796783 [Serendipita vermifera]